MSEIRRCTKCGEEKAATEFRSRSAGSDVLRADCRSCCSARAAEWYRKNAEAVNASVRARRLGNPEQFIAYSRTYRAVNPERCRENRAMRAAKDPRRHADDHLRSRYGVTLAQKNEALGRQGGRCAICGTNNPGSKAGWHLDHDHETGAPRGVLCHKCNTGIGMLGDSVDTLKAAILYLSRPPLRLVAGGRNA